MHKSRLFNLLTVLFFMLLSHEVLFASNVWNVSEMGAEGDGVKLNTVIIQKAIDECSESGGGTVLIEGGIFRSGTLLLKDGVNLSIAEGSILLGSDDPRDYQSIDSFVDATGQVRGKCLIGASGVSHVGLSGKGTIDGQGGSFLRNNLIETMDRLGIDKSEYRELSSNRPFLVRFVNSKNITVRDVELRQPAAWTCHFYQCQHILVDSVKIYSHAHKNNDGIDLDSSSDAIVKNCDINSGDDAVCFKTTSPVATQRVHVSGCRLKSDWGTIKFGTESMGDFKDITIEDCDIYRTRGGGIKILSVDGANIENIRIKDIRMDQVDMPIFIRLGERLRTYREADEQKVGSIQNVTIENIKATTWGVDHSRVSPPSGILITGTPTFPIDSISLKNIDITLPGGGNKEHSKRVIAEDEKRYPEFSFFDVLPSYGMFARHIKTLKTENLNFKLLNPDKREEIVLDDVIEPLMVSLWGDDVPFNKKDIQVEEIHKPMDPGNVFISQVVNPDMSLYLAKIEKPSPVVVICPGGGYRFLAYNHEGRDVARHLANHGISAIVLKYRLPLPDLQEQPSKVPLMDAQRAIELVRLNAQKWNVDPTRVGIMGFSAGGHLASTVSTHWKSPVLADQLTVSVRPDFSILIYPVVSMLDETTHKGSQRNLLGENASDEMKASFSNSLLIDDQTPPAFLVHAVDDHAVSIQNSLDYMQQLNQHGVLYEAHLYPVGGHGFSMRAGYTHGWQNLLVKWIKQLGNEDK